MDENAYMDRLKNTGRNDPCPCGSGKKYKKCHLPEDEAKRHEELEKQQALRTAEAAETETGEESREDKPQKKQSAAWKSSNQGPAAKGDKARRPPNLPRRSAV